METQILRMIAEFLEKQDILNKFIENQILNEYGYSEIHTLKAIEEMESPNVTGISKKLNMTRGAISKITKKLIAKNLIEAYSLPNNKKNIFFKLTRKGLEIYNEHEKRHSLWESRDSDFLSGFSKQQLQQIHLFFEEYNLYLNKKIEEFTSEK